MKESAILLAEHNEALRRPLQSFLLDHGFTVSEARDLAGILRTLRQRRKLDLLIVNASLETTGDGLKAARLFCQGERRLPVIVIATESSEDLAIAALRAGVTDYFKHPFSYEELLASIHRCLADFRPWEEAGPLPAFVGSVKFTNGFGLFPLIGESPRMQEIKAYLLKVAAADSNALITGETGTGKELVADLIHRNSRRQQKPFVCINCAAIPDSLLESELFGYEKGAFTGATSSQLGKMQAADGGSLFFDEIGDMSPYAQAKILRAIETREVQRLGGRKSIAVDVKVIAATNQDLERLMAEDKFRKDLYFRLYVARIHLPPLRERKEDLPALLTYYVSVMNKRFGQEIEGFTDEALEYLLRYDWPGNVRELKNLVEACFVNMPAGKISFLDLPEQFRRQLKAAKALPQSERDRLLSTLLATKWNMTQAAQQLQWSRMTLYRKVAKYQIVRERETTDAATTACEHRL
jgi:DNA-binding NtrC family response regulator